MTPNHWHQWGNETTHGEKFCLICKWEYYDALKIEQAKTEAFPGTLRDFFAGMAIMGKADMNNDCPDEAQAAWAYLLADAMIKEREKNEKK